MKKVLSVIFAAIMAISACVCVNATLNPEWYKDIVPEGIEPVCLNDYGAFYFCPHVSYCKNKGQSFVKTGSSTCPMCGGNSQDCVVSTAFFYGYECPECKQMTIHRNPYMDRGWGKCANCHHQVFENTHEEENYWIDDGTDIIDGQTVTVQKLCVKKKNSAVYPESAGNTKIYRFTYSQESYNCESAELLRIIKDTAAEYGDGYDLSADHLFAGPGQEGFFYSYEKNKLKDCKPADPEVSKTPGGESNKSFWDKIAEFFRNIFNWIANLF